MSEPDPTRVVVDADVLCADLLSGGSAREAMDVIRSHSWLALVCTPRLLDDAEAVIAEFADEDVALAWRARTEELATIVDQEPGDHPALAAAHRGNAAQLISFDEELASARTGATLRPYVSTSVRTPDAFLAVFDPERLYPVVENGEYPGPDRDPRE